MLVEGQAGDLSSMATRGRSCLPLRRRLPGIGQAEEWVPFTLWCRGGQLCGAFLANGSGQFPFSCFPVGDIHIPLILYFWGLFDHLAHRHHQHFSQVVPFGFIRDIVSIIVGLFSTFFGFFVGHIAQSLNHFCIFATALGYFGLLRSLLDIFYSLYSFGHCWILDGQKPTDSIASVQHLAHCMTTNKDRGRRFCRCIVVDVTARKV